MLEGHSFPNRENVDFAPRERFVLKVFSYWKTSLGSIQFMKVSKQKQ